MRCFRTRNLLLSKKCVPLHCVFHSIRFKVNKDWLSGIDSLFFVPTIPYRISQIAMICPMLPPRQNKWKVACIYGLRNE